MKLIEVIVTYMYNSDDATMQTSTIVNSHYITKGQYVAIIVYVYTRTKLVTNLIVVLQWGNKVKG